MHLIGVQVSRLHDLRRARKLLIDIFRIHGKGIAGRFVVSQIVVDLAVLGQSRAWRPYCFQLISRLNGLPRLLSNYTEEVLFHDDFHDSGEISHGVFIDTYQSRSDCRRAHHLPVKHSWHAHVVNVFELARRHGRNFNARHGGSENRPFRCRLPPGASIEREIEFLSADELAIADLFGWIGFRADDAVPGGQLVRGDT